MTQQQPAQCVILKGMSHPGAIFFLFLLPSNEGIKFRDFKACFQNEFLTLTPAIFFLRSPLTKEPYMEKIRELQIINCSSSKIMNTCTFEGKY